MEDHISAKIIDFTTKGGERMDFFARRETGLVVRSEKVPIWTLFSCSPTQSRTVDLKECDCPLRKVLSNSFPLDSPSELLPRCVIGWKIPDLAVP